MFDLSSKELKGKCGIYLIQIADHTYIGSSKSLYSRLAEHRTDLQHNSHSNEMMNKCFVKYGQTAVMYKIVEYCNPEERIVKEKEWIDKIQTDMNMQDPITKQLSETSRLKISHSLKLAYQTGKKSKPIGQPIEMYDIQGNFIKEFKDVYEASKEMKFSTHTIQIAASLYHASRTCGFYRFRYKYSKMPIKTFEYTNTNHLASKFDYVIIEPNGTEIPIKMGVRNINEALLQQLFKGNLEFKIKAKPKVPSKFCELLENPEKDNQQPSSIEI